MLAYLLLKFDQKTKTWSAFEDAQGKKPAVFVNEHHKFFSYRGVVSPYAHRPTPNVFPPT